MPEQLLGRIIRLCSNVGDVVADPFSGSATTVAVAKKLGRQYLGIDLSPEYVNRGRARLDTVCVGDPLEGSPEPNISAPQTPLSGPKGARGRKAAPIKTVVAEVNPQSSQELKIFQRGLLEAYRRSHGGYSLDRVVADPELNQKLADACKSMGLPGESRTWNWTLLGLRKAGCLAAFPALRRTELSWEECDPYLFASEIAWRQMIDDGCDSLDTILCDPSVASAFDEVAHRWAPGFKALQYRWAALKLRKSAKLFRSRAKLLTDARLSRLVDLNGSRGNQLPEASGIYVVMSAQEQPLYAGETTNIRDRISNQFGSRTKKLWKTFGEALAAKYFLTSCPHSTRLAHQRRLIDRHAPLLNLPDRTLHEAQRAVGF
jgi:site-specific DNA-methyltransferase (adenine-specific)